MLEFINKDNNLVVINSDKKSITFDINDYKVSLDNFDVTHPGEYEKAGILLEVKEYNDNLFYSFSIEGYHMVFISSDNFELKEEILSFFGDVDVLLIKGSKESAKVFENIEAKLVIPFGEGKDIFLNTLGQHKEEEDLFKLKGELSGETTEFVHLK